MPSLSLLPTVEVTPAAQPVVELTQVSNTPVIDVILPESPVIEVTSTGIQGPPGLSSNTVEAHDFSVYGNLVPKTGNSRVYFDSPVTVTSVIASVGQSPAGAPVRVDVKKNGASLYTDPLTRPAIFPGVNVSPTSLPAVTSFTAGDYMTVDVLQTGSTVPGAHLTVTVRTRRD